MVFNKIKCFFGYHQWSLPIIASYGISCKWSMFGKKCNCCKKYRFTYADVVAEIKDAYYFGVKEENTRMIAYAKGLDEILKIYPDSPLKYGFIHANKN